jgi:ABC-type nickel/cobalt efflux system permease component RcnA
MNQQPDKLFREKLEGFHKPAPTAAWNKIDAGLRKKNNKTIWLRVAASVLLVAVAAFLIWTTQRTPAERIAIDTNQNNKKESQGQDQKLNQTKAQEKPVLQPEQLEPPTAATIVKKPKQTKAIQSLPVTPAQEEPTMIEEPVIEELVSFTSADNAIDSSVVETMDTIEPVVVVSSIGKKNRINHEYLFCLLKKSMQNILTKKRWLKQPLHKRNHLRFESC